MRKATLSFSALAALATAFTALVFACSSKSSGGPTPQSSYCSTIGSYVDKCKVTDPCSLATVRDCSMTVTNYSNAFLQAVEKCSSSLEATCPTDAGAGADAAAGDDCLTSALAAAPPTATQQKLARDYCTPCAAAQSQSQADCVATFYSTSDGGSGGAGSFAESYSDTVDEKLDEACIGVLSSSGADGCAFPFLLCALTVVQGTTFTPPECQIDAGVFDFDGGFEPPPDAAEPDAAGASDASGTD